MKVDIDGKEWGMGEVAGVQLIDSEMWYSQSATNVNTRLYQLTGTAAQTNRETSVTLIL